MPKFVWKWCVCLVNANCVTLCTLRQATKIVVLSLKLAFEVLEASLNRLDRGSTVFKNIFCVNVSRSLSQLLLVPWIVHAFVFFIFYIAAIKPWYFLSVVSISWQGTLQLCEGSWWTQLVKPGCNHINGLFWHARTVIVDDFSYASTCEEHMWRARI